MGVCVPFIDLCILFRFNGRPASVTVVVCVCVCVCGIVYLRAWIKLETPAVCMYIFPTGPRLASSG